MLDLYTWSTPNGRKVSILLEELGLPYTAHTVDIGKDEQFAPEFLEISPNNKIPAIVDHEAGLSLMESGAILIYLADKYGRFLATSGPVRHHTIEWLMWQMGGFGPMVGQAHHFLRAAKGKSEYAEERFRTEVRRLYDVLNQRLAGRNYLVDDYSVADIAVWPWVARFGWHEVDLNDFPEVKRWYLAIAERPAVVRGYDAPVFTTPIPKPENR
jgi:GST-like protein